MNFGRRGIFIIWMAAVGLILSGGCSPLLVCTVETTVHPDYTCQRLTRLEAYPNPRFQGQRVRLAEHYQFPPAEMYETYAIQQERALFAGLFESYERIPSDLVRNTPGTNAKAGNLFSFRVMDLVLFVLADFDETLTDIVVSREDGERALEELIRLIVPEVMAVLNAKYGAKFDLSRLESYLYNDLPAKLQRIYAGAWAIHSAKRSGVTSPGEEYEYYMFLSAEARREGFELAELGTPNLQQENINRLKEYGVQLAGRLCVPRQGGGSAADMLSGVAVEDLLASIQSAITARHGSINNFIAKIAALLPRSFGAYLTGAMMPLYMLPETTYHYRLRVPGRILQTNAVQELNGDLVWTFGDRDLAFTGQSMWARTLLVREPAAYALGVRGFPESLADVDRLFGLCLSPSGLPREELLTVLGQAVAARGLGPLETLAQSSSADAASAAGILELFAAHRRERSTPSSSAPPPTPEPEPARPLSDALAPVQPLAP